MKDFLGHATVATTVNYDINTMPDMRATAQARKVRLEADLPLAERDGIEVDPKTDL